jgi:MFS family permease
VGLCFFAFVTVSLASGTVYGWPSLRRQLIVEGSMLDEKSLGVIYTCGAWATQACRVGFGIARDRWTGTKITCCISLLCVAGGSLGIAYAGPNNQASLAVSMFFIGLGSGTQICLQPVAGLFSSNYQGTIISSFSGAFQISGLVFVALTSITSDRRKSFASFAGIMLGFVLVAALVLPRCTFKRASTEPTIASADEETEHDEVKQETMHCDGEEEPGENCEDGQRDCSAETEETTVFKLLINPEYIVLVFWFSVLLIPLQYYIGSLGYQLEERGDSNGKYARIFSIIYAASAAVSPFTGIISDSAGLGVAQGFGTILVAGSLFMLASTNISLEAHTAGMIFYGVGRMVVFGTYFTNIGKRFGYTHFGTLTGLGLLVSGLVSLVQYPLIAVASSGYDSKVNIICASVILALLPYCLWLSIRERRGK